MALQPIAETSARNADDLVDDLQGPELGSGVEIPPQFANGIRIGVGIHPPPPPPAQLRQQFSGDDENAASRAGRVQTKPQIRGIIENFHVFTCGPFSAAKPS